MHNRTLRNTLLLASAAGLLGIVLAAVGIFLLQAYALAPPWLTGDAAMPPTFGNFESVRALLRDDPKADAVYFAVVGDSRCTATFDGIMHALEKEPLDFMIHLGDFVQDGTEAAHRLFRRHWAACFRVPFPVFCVVGNHEVDAVDFPVRRFEELYGPSNFFFGYHRCLFIVLRILEEDIGPATTRESLDFLEKVLAEQRSRYDRAFVFLHVPPKVSADIPVRMFEGVKRFEALCDRYHVSYVIAGHHHGYARVRRRETNYLVSGGGGADLRARVFGRFHHAVLLRVGPEGVSERILYAEPKTDLVGAAERMATTYLRPWLARLWYLAVPLDLLLAAAALFALRALGRRVRRARSRAIA